MRTFYNKFIQSTWNYILLKNTIIADDTISQYTPNNLVDHKPELINFIYTHHIELFENLPSDFSSANISIVSINPTDDSTSAMVTISINNAYVNDVISSVEFSLKITGLTSI